MLSIIICSRIRAITEGLSENVKNTVGCEYELIVIDNSENQYSIFEAYNLGIEKSKGKYLAFIHDDIYIHTNNWGEIISRIFEEDEKIGLIGVAGTKIKTKMPSGWWSCPDEYKEIHIIQHLSNKEKEKWEYGFNNTTVSEVVAIDGVFMVLRKNCYLSFNSKLKGFHNYDLNISFECKKNGFKIVVTNQILIEHYSNGVINSSWYESTFKIHNLYKSILPLKTSDVRDFEIFNSLEFKNGNGFVNELLRLGYKKNAMRIWFQLFVLKPNTKFHFRFLKRVIKHLWLLK